MSEEKQTDVIGDLFHQRDQKIKPEPQPLEAEASSPKTEGETPKAEDKPVNTSETKDERDPLALLQEKYEKQEKELVQSQRYAKQKSRQAKEILKKIQGLVDTGTLTEEQAHAFQEVWGNEPLEDTTPSSPLSTHPLASFFALANQELPTLARYTDDPLINEKIKACDFALSLMTPDEMKDFREKLEEAQENPLQVTKIFLALGHKTYEETFQEIQRSGGLKSFLQQKDKNIEKLKQDLDKMKKKLAQYEDYDTPRYRLSETGDQEGAPDPDPLASLFRERDRRRS